jgi:hypothetical protein
MPTSVRRAGNVTDIKALVTVTRLFSDGGVTITITRAYGAGMASGTVEEWEDTGAIGAPVRPAIRGRRLASSAATRRAEPHE